MYAHSSLALCATCSTTCPSKCALFHGPNSYIICTERCQVECTCEYLAILAPSVGRTVYATPALVAHLTSTGVVVWHCRKLAAQVIPVHRYSLSSCASRAANTVQYSAFWLSWCPLSDDVCKRSMILLHGCKNFRKTRKFFWRKLRKTNFVGVALFRDPLLVAPPNGLCAGPD